MTVEAWAVPDGPHFGVTQEILARDEFYEWRMLVACALLNRTTGRQARRALVDVFDAWPTPDLLAKADLVDLARAIKGCGFQNRRARSLVSMSAAYARGDPVETLPGVGRYALDSRAIFVLGRTDLAPTDKRLSAYLDWKKRETACCSTA